ncbi:hypothetical protein [Nocardia rhizosphaerae]|uniref:WXG100 family type VII secretion target n=1 Tax=Nocardia rhizosphaerae TaxID=1691571 RepID=A0ABV8L1X3_9NOCA
MSGILNIDTTVVRQQGAEMTSASQELSAVAGSWGNMFAENDLGDEYSAEAKNIVAGFEAVASAVKNWSSSCSAFGDAFTNSADNAQYTDNQFAGEVNRVSVDSKGDLTVEGK